MPKILIIEDDQDVRELVKHTFSLRDFSVLEAEDGKTGLGIARKKFPDLIILDLMLPDIDGMDICKTLKEKAETKDIPVLMLTARTTVIERVKGLEIGADDYLTKPFDSMELIARAKVLLRRTESSRGTGRTPIKMGSAQIDPISYTLEIQGKKIPNLTPKEFDILYVLVKNAPSPVSRENLYRTIWGRDKNENTRVIDIHVSKIRKKIGEHRIKTIPAKGYFFSAT